MDFLVQRKISLESIKLYGLGLESSKIHKFYNRIIIPIRTPHGELMGYQGRVIDPEINPKYLFTKGLLKQQTLFGFDVCAKDMFQQDVATITEGTLNQIILRQAGIPSVAKMGTGISETQMALLARVTDNVVVVEDGDKYGTIDAETTNKLLQANGFNSIVMSLKDFQTNDANDFVLEYSFNQLHEYWYSHL